MVVTVAGFGNVLRADDGFGVRVVEALRAAPVPDGVQVLDIGIGGIHLVQDLMVGTDALVLVDAVDVGRVPGTVVVLDPPRPDVRSWSPTQRRDALADVHYATPERALLLGQALDVLPPVVHMVGCQHAEGEGLGIGLSAPVARAVPVAADQVRRLVTQLGCPWTVASGGGATSSGEHGQFPTRRGEGGTGRRV